MLIYIVYYKQVRHTQLVGAKLHLEELLCHYTQKSLEIQSLSRDKSCGNACHYTQISHTWLELGYILWKCFSLYTNTPYIVGAKIHLIEMLSLYTNRSYMV